MRQTLCRDERLRSRKWMERLRQQGIAVKAPSLILVYLPVESSVFPLSSTSVMFSVSKRIYNRAVDRNRIKRLMRESFRTQKEIIHPVINDKHLHCLMQFIFTGKQLPEYPYVYSRVSELLKRMLKQLAINAEALKNPNENEN
ncbi:MAG: ribonuclease P protein component [Flavobacteriales bacterium]